MSPAFQMPTQSRRIAGAFVHDTRIGRPARTRPGPRTVALAFGGTTQNVLRETTRSPRVTSSAS